jgi:hypothetical protein
VAIQPPGPPVRRAACEMMRHTSRVIRFGGCSDSQPGRHRSELQAGLPVTGYSHRRMSWRIATYREDSYLFPRPPDRCRILAREAPCPGSARSEAEGRALGAPLTGSFPGDRIARRGEDGPAALAGAVNRRVTAGTAWRRVRANGAAAGGPRRASPTLRHGPGPPPPAARLPCNPQPPTAGTLACPMLSLKV